MSTDRVLVTGGTGFLGRRLALRLRDQGCRVTVVGRNAQAGRELEGQGLVFLRADLQDREGMEAACRGMDYVFHCGALSSPWGRPGQFYSVNVLGTQNIIRGCKKQGVRRLIHTSTASLYFEYRDRFNLREDAPLPRRPVNDYARTKLLAEAEVDMAFREGLAVVTLRPSGIFGPGDTSLLPRVIRANQERFFPLLSKGKVYQDLTYVENVVDALVLCRDAPAQVLGKRYNITNGEPVSLYGLVEDLITRLGYRFSPRRVAFTPARLAAGVMELVSRLFPGYKEPLFTQYSLGLLRFSRTLDISAAKTDLGYRPRVGMTQALEEVVRHWHEDNGNQAQAL